MNKKILISAICLIIVVGIIFAIYKPNYKHSNSAPSQNSIIASLSIKNIPVNPPITPTSTKVSSVHIDSILPASGIIGTTVTISGSGFTANNTVLLDDLVASHDVHLSSFTNGHQSLSFIIPLIISPDCKTGQPCPMFERKITPGDYSITIENQNGISNSTIFKVTPSTK